MATLGSVCRFLNGGTPSKAVQSYFEGDIPWITSADISGPIANYARSFITEDAVRNSAVNKVAAGSVLLVTRTGVGKVAIAEKELCFSQDITALIPDKSKLDAGYLVHFLQTKKPHFLSLARGATIQGITRNVVSDLSIPLLPLAEQRRIAAILDQADALRAKRRKVLAQLDSLTQSIFIEMFGNPVQNERGWEIKRLEHAVEGKYGVKAGPFGSSLKKEDYSESGYRVYGQEQVIAGTFIIGNYYISASKFEQLKSCAVSEGDLLVSLVGSFGKVLIVPPGIEPVIINPRLLKITPRKALLESLFLAHLIGSKAIQDKLISVSHGGTMGILNAGLLKDLEVILPPVSEQRSFARRIEAVREIQATNFSALDELNKLFASLQHRAFQGEL